MSFKGNAEKLMMELMELFCIALERHNKQAVVFTHFSQETDVSVFLIVANRLKPRSWVQPVCKFIKVPIHHGDQDD